MRFSGDKLGSMTSKGPRPIRSTNGQKELTEVGTTVLLYDNSGNTIMDDHGQILRYDAWNRLVGVKDLAGRTLRRFSIDGLGRRVTETPIFSGNITLDMYYSSQWQVIEEDRENSGLVLNSQYVWSPVYVDALLLRDYDFSVDGSFNVYERVYAIQDANFNVTGLIQQQNIGGDTGGGGSVSIGDWFTLQAHWNKHVIGGTINGDFNNDGHSRREWCRW